MSGPLPGPVTVPDIVRKKERGEKIVMLTAYDASFAALEDRCGVDVILVGDSLGNALQGHRTTRPDTLEHMAYNTECVARAQGRPGKGHRRAPHLDGDHRHRRRTGLTCLGSSDQSFLENGSRLDSRSYLTTEFGWGSVAQP
jgi:hypothetical protein